MTDDVQRVDPTGKRGGEWITFGAEAYRVPPLSFRGLQDLGERIAGLAAIAGVPTGDQIAAINEIVHAAMERNYPDITVLQVADLVDLENFSDVLGAVLRISGFKPRAPGDDPGEAVASTGEASTSP